ncbi:MAG: MBL fold metallo-hydrolase, partial [Lachnospiraceae bacterium]|nr:MBL fold metallo-hydrolase [Lachnospiraceae bacterium]
MIKKKFVKRIAIAVAALIAATGVSIGTGVFSGGNKTDRDIKDVSGELQIHYIDVGQGDATLIQCDGMNMLIDAGENDKGMQVRVYLEKQGVKKLDYVIGTHPDSDHIGGLDVVIYNFDCGTILMPDYEKDTKTYDDVIQTIKNKHYKITEPIVGTTYELGQAEFTIIAPNRDYDDANDASIGLVLTYGEQSFLFTGDAEEAAEADIVKNGIDIQAKVYKAGHHGSRTSSSEELLELVKPEIVVISCGEDNSYGHPHADILNYCRTNKIPVYRTDMQGTIVVKTDGK